MKKRALVLLLGGAMQLLCAQSLSAPSRTFVTLGPIATVTVTPGHATPMRFLLTVKPGFHINSSKPLMPELIPTQLHFSLPGDLIVGRVQYPAGQLASFPFDPQEKLSVYSGDVVIKAMVIAQASASPGPHTVHGELKYQACDDRSCYPPRTVPLQFNVRVGSARRHVRPHPNAQSPHIH